MFNSFYEQKEFLFFFYILKPFYSTDIPVFIYRQLGNVCILPIHSWEICIPCALGRVKPVTIPNSG